MRFVLHNLHSAVQRARGIYCFALLLAFAAGSAQAGVLVDLWVNSHAADVTNVQLKNGALVAGNTWVGVGGAVLEAGPLVPGSTKGRVEISQSGLAGTTFVSSNVVASANLATGKLGAGVTGNAANVLAMPMGLAQAQFGDTLTFVNSTAAPVSLGINWQISGDIIDQTGTGTEFAWSDLVFGVPGISPNNLGLAGAPAGYDKLRYYYLNGAFSITGNWGNYLESNPVWTVTGSGLDRQMQATWNFLPGTTIVDITALLHTDCRGGSICDYSHTAGFTFDDLPTGLTYTSESGVFLKGERLDGQVPEPSTWAMSVLGGVLVLLSRRQALRKRRD